MDSKSTLLTCLQAASGKVTASIRSGHCRWDCKMRRMIGIQAMEVATIVVVVVVVGDNDSVHVVCASVSFSGAR